ncbi:homeobox-leucine zipper protein ATHB-14-like isoform X2 [Gastrolobium bilobum]|uniref:homeobox-leucine zipper protein ATHB-14-like isoform X2 n=1 Tax=Gastrolobium bilobum TaxID=150636 RepID=UPI002AB09198|nr:homeobox-leucine zipper protein ATHB-14-like isoform X2 [Gastrolobium bilobum]
MFVIPFASEPLLQSSACRRSQQALPMFTFANQAGLYMLETTLVALQDIKLEKIFDDHGRLGFLVSYVFPCSVLQASRGELVLGEDCRFLLHALIWCHCIDWNFLLGGMIYDGLCVEQTKSLYSYELPWPLYFHCCLPSMGIWLAQNIELQVYGWPKILNCIRE